MSRVHAQARTTPRTRAEIRASSASLGELAKRYNISRATVRKWKRRDSPDDLSHRPHTLHTTLLPVQEAIAVELRRLLLGIKGVGPYAAATLLMLLGRYDALGYAKAGANWYEAQGFSVSRQWMAGVTHEMDGMFGGVVAAQIDAHGG